eukprot:8163267-Alexandrium_andersonii.AAC.1
MPEHWWIRGPAACRRASAWLMSPRFPSPPYSSSMDASALIPRAARSASRTRCRAAASFRSLA